MPQTDIHLAFPSPGFSSRARALVKAGMPFTVLVSAKALAAATAGSIAFLPLSVAGGPVTLTLTAADLAILVAGLGLTFAAIGYLALREGYELELGRDESGRPWLRFGRRGTKGS